MPSKKRTPGPATPSSSPSPSGFSFADPHATPDNYTSFSSSDVKADTAVQASQVLQPIPALKKDPPVMSLADVLPSSALKPYSKFLTFHMAGDTGGVKNAANQFLVADKMVEDFSHPDAAARPAFFYHLGDVVYYFGQDKYYYDQFYDPYRDYPAPILAIPGNHDAVVYSGEPAASLEAFQKHFCSPAPTHADEAQGTARTTMTQPGVYFTLNSPFVRIIGLYSNTAEAGGVIAGPTVGQAQLQFLTSQLQQAGADRKKGALQGALLIAVHHPPFTGSAQHNPSPEVLTALDSACKQTGVHPDAVFSGHAHLYERYTRYLKIGNAAWQVPYVVAGNGGYPNLAGLKHNPGTPAPRTPVDSSNGDGKGNRLTLENYFGSTFGFLRLTAAATVLSCEFVGVTNSEAPGQTLDRFSLDLATHQLTGFRQQ
ncbi:MAG TPA: metallophosphoesterase [Methylomirabilota bacterium]|nr:metallophosphoesterase [Methylomirabilota bacterium]